MQSISELQALIEVAESELLRTESELYHCSKILEKFRNSTDDNDGEPPYSEGIKHRGQADDKPIFAVN